MKMKTLIINIKLMVVILLVGWLVWQVSIILEQQEISKQIEVKEVFVRTKALTIDNVLTEICKNDIKYPLVVLRQSLLETGSYKCSNCSLDYNNIFGFRLKEHMSSSNKAGYIPFDNWQQSVRFYRDWQLRYLKPTDSDYYEFLKRMGYAEDPNYIAKLKNLRLD